MHWSLECVSLSHGHGPLPRVAQPSQSLRAHGCKVSRRDWMDEDDMECRSLDPERDSLSALYTTVLALLITSTIITSRSIIQSEAIIRAAYSAIDACRIGDVMVGIHARARNVTVTGGVEDPSSAIMKCVTPNRWFWSGSIYTTKAGI